MVHEEGTRHEDGDLVQLQWIRTDLRRPGCVRYRAGDTLTRICDCTVEDCIPRYRTIDIGHWLHLPLRYAGQPAQRSVS